jgi:alanine racemase
MQGNSRARLYIDLAALVANYTWLANLAKPAHCAAAVKANAYGLGLAPVVRALMKAGCDHFFVATLEEGIQLRGLAPNTIIYILDGITQPEDVQRAELNGLIPILNSSEQIHLWRTRNGPFGLMIDTGINRLGLDYKNTHLEDYTDLNVVLLLSHLACADEENNPFNETQLKRFSAQSIAGFNTPKSLANSAGILLGTDYHFDMVRPGIALYGGHAGPKGAEQVQQVVTAYARILQIRDVIIGESVGYNSTWTAKRNSRIAILGVGYADGYGRGFSNRGSVYCEGVHCPVVGRVSMDMTLVDVTEAPHIKVGNDAEILGPNIPLNSASAASGLSQYELLTGLGARYERHYVE